MKKTTNRTPVWSPTRCGWRGGREVWGITWSDGTEGEYFMDPDGLVPIWEERPDGTLTSWEKKKDGAIIVNEEKEA